MVRPNEKEVFTTELILPSRVIIVIGILINLYEAIIHINDAPRFATQNLGFLIFNLLGYIFILTLKRVRRLDVLERQDWLRIGRNLALTFIAIFITQLIITYFLEAERYAVTNLDIYLFFISAAIAEETFFRAFLITSFDLVIGERIKNRLGKFIVLSLASTVFFVVGHYVVYGDNNLLLLDIWIGGFILSSMFIWTKGDYFAVVMAHIFNNAIYAGVTVTNSIFSTLDVTPAFQAISVIAIILIIYFSTYAISRFDRKLDHKELIHKERKYK